MINMTILSSITDNTAGKLNIIPFTGTATRLSWKCDSFNRIGVDYAIQMPLAKCLTDEMDTYKFQKQDIPKEHPEDFTKILTVGIDLCDALIVMQMHQNKLIHQDIKPQNIFCIMIITAWGISVLQEKKIVLSFFRKVPGITGLQSRQMDRQLITDAIFIRWDWFFMNWQIPFRFIIIMSRE